MIEDIDLIDRKLLYYFDHGGRLSCSEIARKLRRGRDTIEYRLERLIDRKIITGFRAVVNPACFGLTLFKTYIRLASHKARVKDLIAKLKKEPRVFWIVECDGSCDLIISIAANSAFEFHEIQGRVLAEISDILVSSEVFVVVGFKVFRLKYLHEMGTHWYEVGGRPRTPNLDQVEIKLLKLLSQRGRDSISELARKLDVSSSVVVARMQKLESEKIILGYQAQIDLDRLGITQFKTQLYLNDYNVEEELRLEEYCNKHSHITCYIRQIGECRAEIESHVTNYPDYNKLIDGLRERFPKLIRNTNSMLMHTEYLNWMVI